MSGSVKHIFPGGLLIIFLALLLGPDVPDDKQCMRIGYSQWRVLVVKCAEAEEMKN